MRRANQVRHNMKPEIRTGLGLGQGQYKKYSALRDSRRRIILPTPWGFRGSKTVTLGGERGEGSKTFDLPPRSGGRGVWGAAGPPSAAECEARSEESAEGGRGVEGAQPPSDTFFLLHFLLI